MMFDDLPLFQPTQKVTKLKAQWEACKKRNPSLIPELARLAREMKTYGHKRYSIDGLFHILRWETRAETGDLGLKMKNNYTAFAARDLMDQYPELKGFFQLRTQKPHGKSLQGNWGQIH